MGPSPGNWLAAHRADLTFGKTAISKQEAPKTEEINDFEISVLVHFQLPY